MTVATAPIQVPKHISKLYREKALKDAGQLPVTFSDCVNGLLEKPEDNNPTLLKKRQDLCLYLIQKHYIAEFEAMGLSQQLAVFEIWPRLGDFQARQLLRVIGNAQASGNLKDDSPRRLRWLAAIRAALTLQPTFWIEIELRFLELENIHSDHIGSTAVQYWSLPRSAGDQLFARSYFLERAKISDKIWLGVLSLANEIKADTSEYVQIRLCELMAQRDLPSTSQRSDFVNLGKLSDRAYLALVSQ